MNSQFQGRTLRQVGALLQLQFRHWTRSSLNPSKKGPEVSRQRQAGIVLRLLFLLGLSPSLWRLAAPSRRLGEGHTTAVACAIFGVFIGLAMLPSLQALGASKAKVAISPMSSPWLEHLPFHPATRVVAFLARNWLVGFYVLIIVLGSSPTQRETLGGWAFLLAMGGLLALTSLTFGQALLGLLRWAVPIHRLRPAKSVVSLLAFAGLGLTMGPSMDLPLQPLEPFFSSLGLDNFSNLLVEPSFSIPWTAWLIPLAIAGGSTVSIVLAERTGYDRLEASPIAPPRRTQARLTWPTVNWLLMRREGGVWLIAFFSVLLLGLGIFLASLEPLQTDKRMARYSLIGFHIMCLYMGSMFVLTQASRGVLRDVQARSLLSALPMDPSETLQGKARSLIRLMSPIFVVQGGLVIAALVAEEASIAGRIVCGMLANWLLCGTSASVAFLSNGVAGPPLGRLSLDRILVLFPLLGIAIASNTLMALPPLLALVLIRAAAAQAARRSVRWFDDPDDVQAARAPVWRALLVFASFMAIQAVSATVLGVFLEKTGWLLAVSFLVSAGALVAMTIAQRDSSLPLQWRPRNWAAPVCGLALGAASGGLAQLYLYGLHTLGWEPEVQKVTELAQSEPSKMAEAAVLVAVVLAAPLAEEMFFRGWLQRAIESELKASLSWVSVILAALFFASIHPAISFIPVLVLGVIAGTVYRKGLGLLSCVAVHMGHNALVSWFG